MYYIFILLFMVLISVILFINYKKFKIHENYIWMLTIFIINFSLIIFYISYYYYKKKKIIGTYGFKGDKGIKGDKGDNLILC